MTQKGELRRHARATQAAPVQLAWKDRSGVTRVAIGRTVNVSELGMQVEMPHPFEKQSYVNLRVDDLGLHGSASVRNCVRKGPRFLIGLEFSGGLKWKPKAKIEPSP
jgi:hypothetical protein